MDAPGFVAALRTDNDRLVAAVRAAADPAALRVPGCPDWSLADLIVHLGRVQRWATGIVADGASERPKFAPPPEAGTDLADWFDEGGEALAETLDLAVPNAPAWNFTGQNQTMSFWIRRQCQEAAVHRWDAQSALGATEPIETDVALDGLSEWCEVLAPMAAGAFKGGGETLHLHATDATDDGDGEWVLTFGPDGLLIERGHAKADAAVRGPASDLLLVLYNRRPVEGLELFGAAAVVDRVHAFAF